MAHLAEAKVDQLGISLRIDEHILGLEVAVDLHPHAPRGRERQGWARLTLPVRGGSRTVAYDAALVQVLEDGDEAARVELGRDGVHRPLPL